MSYTPLTKLTITGLIATSLSIAAIGCGSPSADQQVQDDLAKARVAAARGEEGATQAIQLLQTSAGQTDTSEAMSALAKAALGDAQYNSAIDALRQVDALDVQSARLVLDIGALARQLAVGGATIDGYKKSDPKAAQAEIEKRIAEAQGAADKPAWYTFDKTQLPTLAAVTQNIAKLQADIDQKQAQIKQLNDQKTALVAQADQSAQASEKQTGREAVDSYNKSSDLRKQAADLATQAETLKAQIIPLQADLAVAQAQQQILNKAIAEFKDQSQKLDENWKQVQGQIAVQQEIAKQIVTGGGAATTQLSDGSAGNSISQKAAALSQNITEADKLRDGAVDNLTAAATSFEQAFTAAQSARTKVSESSGHDAQQISGPAFKVLLDAANPALFRVRQAGAELAKGDALTRQAAALKARVALRDLLANAAGATGAQVPQELADANLDKLLKEKLDGADAAYDHAESLLEDIIGSSRQSTELEKQTVQSAQIAQIFARWAHMQEALLAGNADKARELDQKAQESVKSAAQSEIVLPALPGNLRAAIPAPAPTSAPATEPTTAPAASAGATSADEQAVRAVLVSFADALDRGNMEAARPLCQIDPGQDQSLVDLMNLFGNFKRLKEAAQAKYSDAAKPLLSQFPDPSAMFRIGKISIKGEDAFIEGITQPGAKRGDAVRVNGQWKVLIEAPETEEEKKEAQMVPKLAAAMGTLAADVQAGKYPTVEAFTAALQQAMQGLGG